MAWELWVVFGDCYLEKIKFWVSHMHLKHTDFGGKAFHEVPENQICLVSLQDLIQKGASFLSLLNMSVCHILEANKDSQRELSPH